MDFGCPAKDTPPQITAERPALAAAQQPKLSTAELEAQDRWGENHRNVLLLFDILDLHAGGAAAGAQRELPGDVRDVGAPGLQERQQKQGLKHGSKLRPQHN